MGEMGCDATCPGSPDKQKQHHHITTTTTTTTIAIAVWGAAR